MPPKSHRPGLPRTHSRTSSTGSSSRAGAFGNLQLTQKEPGPSNNANTNGNFNGGGKVEKARRNGHAHDVRCFLVFGFWFLLVWLDVYPLFRLPRSVVDPPDQPFISHAFHMSPVELSLIRSLIFIFMVYHI